MTLKLGMKHCLCKYYQDCSNYDPGFDFDPFYAKVKFDHIGFYMGKKEFFFLETIAALGLKLLEAFS